MCFSALLLANCATVHGVKYPEKTVQLKSGYTLHRNVIFTPDSWPETVRGDFYQPAKTRPTPAVLLVHGGGWTGTDGRWQMNSIAKSLVKRGYAVFNVTYRLAPRWTYPAPVEDLNEALRWMRSNAAELNLDPSRIAAFGYSAGGYLAAMVALPEHSGIRAIVMGGAPSDLTLYPGGKLVPQFLGGTQQEIPARFQEASPVNSVNRLSPPVFLYHASKDELVKPEHAWEMMHALGRKNVRNQIYWIEHRGHIAAFLFPSGAIHEAINFLDIEMQKTEL